MKKALVLLLVILLVVPVLSYGKGITGKGVKLGLNFATFGGDDAEDAKIINGLALGGFIIYNINKKFDLQPETYYTLKGAKFQHDLPPLGTFTNKYYYSYIEISVLARYNLDLQKKFKPFLFLGPEMAFYLGGISVVESEWGAGEGDVEDINDLDFGIILGGGIDYPLGKGILSVDLRYDLGLTKIYAPVYNNSIKNRVFSIFLSYGIK